MAAKKKADQMKQKMGKTAFLMAISLICFLLLTANASAQSKIGITGFVSMIQESNYQPLKEDLIVVEITPEGEPIEKRLAKEADLFFYRKLKVKVLFGVGGVIGYENEFVLSLHNISDRELANVSVIEEIPVEIIASAADITSDNNFLILNESPAILSFSIEKMPKGEEKRLSYKITKTEKKVSEEMLELMTTIKALIALEENSCVGIICKDSNPCTRDYCEKGECLFEPLPDTTPCKEGNQCIAGKCVAAEENGMQPSFELIGFAFLATAIVFSLIVLMAKRRKKAD